MNQRVGEAVMEFLTPKPGEAAPKRRNKRLTVVPGKAVSAEDVEQMEAAEKAQKEAKNQNTKDQNRTKKLNCVVNMNIWVCALL